MLIISIDLNYINTFLYFNLSYKIKQSDEVIIIHDNSCHVLNQAFIPSYKK